MISVSKSTLSLNNFKILRPKVTNNLTNLPKKFCEIPPQVKLTCNQNITVSKMQHRNDLNVTSTF